MGRSNSKRSYTISHWKTCLGVEENANGLVKMGWTVEVTGLYLRESIQGGDRFGSHQWVKVPRKGQVGQGQWERGETIRSQKRSLPRLPIPELLLALL